MSLQHSVQPPATAEALAALRAAVEEVAGKSLCAYTEPCDRGRFLEAWRSTLPTAVEPTAGASDTTRTGTPAQETSGVWYCTSVVFHGPFSGDVGIVLTRALTLELYCSFAGMTLEANPSEAELRDFAAEFANVVCGHWLTRTYTHLKFDLGVPVVDVLLPEPEAPQTPWNDLAAHLFICVNDVPLQVTFAPRAQRLAS
jgi:hypothetical protein